MICDCFYTIQLQDIIMLKVDAQTIDFVSNSEFTILSSDVPSEKFIIKHSWIINFSLIVAGILGIQYLFRSCSNIAPVIYDFKNRRGWEHYVSLFIRFGIVSWIVYSQLDLPLLRRKLLRFDRYYCWHSANYSILRLFLFVYYQR